MLPATGGSERDRPARSRGFCRVQEPGRFFRGAAGGIRLIFSHPGKEERLRGSDLEAGAAPPGLMGGAEADLSPGHLRYGHRRGGGLAAARPRCVARHYFYPRSNHPRGGTPTETDLCCTLQCTERGGRPADPLPSLGTGLIEDLGVLPRGKGAAPTHLLALEPKLHGSTIFIGATHCCIKSWYP